MLVFKQLFTLLSVLFHWRSLQKASETSTIYYLFPFDIENHFYIFDILSKQHHEIRNQKSTFIIIKHIMNNNNNYSKGIIKGKKI